MARSRQTTTEYLDELQQEAEQAMRGQYENDLDWEYPTEHRWKDYLPDEVGLSEMPGVPMFTL